HFLFFIGAVGILVFLPLYFLKHTADAAQDAVKNKIIDLLKIICIIGVFTLVINANWIAANLTGQSRDGGMVSAGITRDDLVAFQTSGKTSMDVLRNVVMMSGFWGKDQFRYLDLTSVKDNWGRSFLFLLPLILWGIMAAWRAKGQRRVLSISLIVLFLIAVILAAGIRIPIGKEISNFLFDHLPLYKGLREPQKWVSVIVLVYLIFLSLGMKELFLRKIVIRHDVLMKIIAGAIIISNAPFMLFGFAGQMKPKSYPKDWSEVNTFIVEDSQCDGKILFLPWHLYMKFSWTNKVSANPAPVFFECPVISGSNMEWGGIYDNSQNVVGRAVEGWLGSKGKTDLLQNDAYGIKYVILAKEADWKKYEGIEQNPELERVKETPGFLVYRVKKAIIPSQ
ncbi:MAG: hypothetical protein Q7K29_08390, partial [Thermoleophilia bacterium]|nr:hypothetical protein [Thermoleophilia bacterium]